MNGQKKESEGGHAWTNPQITILVRTAKDEAVLATCKTDGGASGSMGRDYGSCNFQEPYVCVGTCDTISNS